MKLPLALPYLFIQVQSFLRQGGSGKKDISSAEMRMGHFKILFTFIQAYAGKNDEKSVCEVHFVMQSQKVTYNNKIPLAF